MNQEQISEFKNWCKIDVGFGPGYGLEEYIEVEVDIEKRSIAEQVMFDLNE